MKAYLLALIGLFILLLSIISAIELQHEIEAVRSLRENLYDR